MPSALRPRPGCARPAHRHLEGRPGRLESLAASGLGALLVLGTLCLPLGRAGASVGSDRAKIAQLEARIAKQGDVVQSLVTAYNSVEARLASIQRSITANKLELASDTRAEQSAAVRLRGLTVAAYVNATAGSTINLPAGSASSNGTSLPDQQVYLGVASGNLDNAMATFSLDKRKTAVVANVLATEQAQTTATLRQVEAAQSAAQAAMAADQATLRQVDSNLLGLVIAAEEEREAEQEEAEEQAMTATQQQGPGQASPSASPATHPAPGTYANPLRSIVAITPERVDQGVDFGGFGPIYAIGDGVVLSTYNGGWPGGTFISYRLTDGPADGLVVYAAEDIDPVVHVGEAVNASTELGTMYEGPAGIETGWADASGDGTTMAMDAGQFGGSNSTAFGANFSELLQSLGAPGGVMQNEPATGGLPGGWPRW